LVLVPGTWYIYLVGTFRFIYHTVPVPVPVGPIIHSLCRTYSYCDRSFTKLN